MTLFFILLSLAILGIIVSIKSSEYDFAGFMIAVLAIITLIFHIVVWSLSSYHYNKRVVQREAFTSTLEYARENNHQLELAAITQEILQWNQELESDKYDNSLFVFDCYIDDRVMNLKPIR